MKNIKFALFTLAFAVLSFATGFSQEDSSSQETTTVTGTTVITGAQDNPFEEGISNQEIARRAVDVFVSLESTLSVALTLLIGWLFKLFGFKDKAPPRMKKLFAAILFLASFVASMLFIYGFDFTRTLTVAISVGTAILAHTVVINPIEEQVPKMKIVKSED